MMANISHFTNVRWFLGKGPLCHAVRFLISRYIGIPFNATNPFRLDIVEAGQAILGDYLLGLQAGNEPDFYQQFGKRPAVSPSFADGAEPYLRSALYTTKLL